MVNKRQWRDSLYRANPFTSTGDTAGTDACRIAFFVLLGVMVMYSFKVEPQHTRQPAIRRSMVSDNAIELIPVIIEICRTEFSFVNPVALYMGDGKYRLFDLDNPIKCATVQLYDDTSENN